MQSSEICMFYLRGACRFSSRCWNSHDLTTYRTPKRQALTAATTAAYYEEGYSQFSPSTSASTSASTSTSGASIQGQGLQILLEASIKPILKQSGDSEIAIEKAANELSVAMKTGNGKTVKETASKLHSLHQQKMKENKDENDTTGWEEIIQGAIDSDLQCNICFEIFIKPTVLNCSHTFCDSCIYVWTKRVKKCPICRVQIKSKSFCLTLDRFIEKIVEHLPKEIQCKREVAIKDRNKMRAEKPPRLNHRLNTRDLAALLSMEELLEADTPSLDFLSIDRNDDINADVIVEESEMFRMNLHDTVISTRGVNPLMSYIVPEEQAANRPITRPHNSSARH